MLHSSSVDLSNGKAKTLLFISPKIHFPGNRFGFMSVSAYLSYSGFQHRPARTCSKLNFGSIIGSGFAPASMRSREMSVCPSLCAIENAVSPSSVRALTSAPTSINIRTTTICPWAEAIISAVNPLWSWVFTSAPASISIRVISECPVRDASISAVAPSLV